MSDKKELAFPPPTYTKTVDEDHDDRGYVTSRTVTYVPEVEGGLTLRDYFAGQVLAAFGPQVFSDRERPMLFCYEAYYVADCMLKAREKITT